MIPSPFKRFTVEEYHQLIEFGIFTENDSLELLEGLIVGKSPDTPALDAILDQAQEVFLNHLPKGWRLRIQSAITTPDSEPEPDMALVPGPAKKYQSRHPEPAEIALVIEVSDTTLWHDCTVKSRLYSQAEIGQYWIINLVDQRIEAYSNPAGNDQNPRYLLRTDYTPGASIPLIIGGQTVAMLAVREILGYCFDQDLWNGFPRRLRIFPESDGGRSSN